MSRRAILEISGGDVPSPLYKFLRREHARAWLEKGQIRIGTFSSFRQAENFSGDVGDAQEGNKLLWEQPAIVDTSRAETMTGPGRSSISVVGPGRAVFTNTRFEEKRVSVDYFMLSLSSEFSGDAMRQVDPAYDACVRIDDAKAFFRALTHTLHRSGISSKLLGVQPCVYRDRTIHIADAGARVAVQLLKEPRFAYQKEVRAIWEPTQRESIEATLTPRNVESPDAARFCSPCQNC